jgi:hypothetical protein
MYQLRYLTYLVLSILGGAFLTKFIPTSTTMVNACWLMVGNILYELIEWKYNIQEDEKNDTD